MNSTSRLAVPSFPILPTRTLHSSHHHQPSDSAALRLLSSPTDWCTPRWNLLTNWRVKFKRSLTVTTKPRGGETGTSRVPVCVSVGLSLSLLLCCVHWLLSTPEPSTPPRTHAPCCHRAHVKAELAKSNPQVDAWQTRALQGAFASYMDRICRTDNPWTPDDTAKLIKARVWCMCMCMPRLLFCCCTKTMCRLDLEM